MKFKIITIFPKVLDSYFGEGIIGRACKNKALDIRAYDLRDWTSDKHRTVDDAPYGGGAGMVMKIEPLYKALRDLAPRSKKSKIILLSAKGKKWNQQLAKKYSKLNELVLVCGRYEGVDERILKFVDEEISIGDYVLTGGEIGAMAIVDSVSRLLPGVLGNKASLEDESHSKPGLLEYPQYTRPEVFIVDGKKIKVPKILLSGDHEKIKKWRTQKRKKQK